MLVHTRKRCYKGGWMHISEVANPVLALTLMAALRISKKDLASYCFPTLYKEKKSRTTRFPVKNKFEASNPDKGKVLPSVRVSDPGLLLKPDEPNLIIMAKPACGPREKETYCSSCFVNATLLLRWTRGMPLLGRIISYNVLRCNYDAPDCLFLKGTLFLSHPRLLLNEVWPKP
ncbi:hypothetical protein Prudu_000751 [Prunus dulcis]|uniref:Uncharacterized protein n=1 Tax=Prunus dulcis TaxID=3755 RepID=A0A4Y1QLY4_PRUDU|nr:hypothetical protein Prudu_000751 [Prunus dulcis]